MTTVEMPHVSECTVSSCSYKHDGCHAYAINSELRRAVAAS